MPVEPNTHPDRRAATLVQVAEAGDPTRFEPPGRGARDCRIDLKLLQWRAEQACRASAAARAHLARWPQERHPDLWAGTVQDGVARGFAAALEEAISLAPLTAQGPMSVAADAKVTTGKELRRRREVLIASGGPRVRFSRKLGCTFVDRAGEVSVENCLRFEARRDCGSLDDFVGAPDERARLFSAQFLPAVELVEGPGRVQLRLAGRLGRKVIGWPIALTIDARADEPVVRLRIELTAPAPGWRLRARFLGVPSANLVHHCTDVREVVTGSSGSFTAFSLVRSCPRLRVDGAFVPTPAAAAPGLLVHDFELTSSQA